MANTMLIIDDDDISRTILSAMFKDTYHIIEANNGKQALEIIYTLKDKISIVLLDLVMQPVNGYDILKKRKTERDFFIDIPVIVITALTTTDDQLKALKLEANDYITKPFIPDIIHKRVDNIMLAQQKILALSLESKTLQIELQRDKMTGIYNKATVEELIAKALATNTNKLLNALIVIDIDNFKQVNDTFGHLAGDTTIKNVANLLAEFFRKSDYVGRIGGDEFIVFMRDIPSANIAREKIKQLVTMLKHDTPSTSEVNITISAGLVFTNHETVDYKDLFHKADMSLYHAKLTGKARVEEYGVFSAENTISLSTAVLLSHNPAVTSLIPLITPLKIELLQTLKPIEFEKIEKNQQHTFALAIIDIADFNNTTIIDFFKTHDFSKFKKVIVICAEGCMLQYKIALHYNADDIITLPIEEKIYKRRFSAWLQN